MLKRVPMQQDAIRIKCFPFPSFTPQDQTKHKDCIQSNWYVIVIIRTRPTLVILSQIPIIAGVGAPRYPGKDDGSASWTAQADKFASFCIALHLPWDLETRAPPIPLTYNALMSWVSEMHANHSYRDRATLFWIRNLVQGFSIPPQTLSIVSKWRSRYAHVWSAADRQSTDDATKAAEKEEGFADQVLRELQETYSLFVLPQDGRDSNIQVQHALNSLCVFDDHVQPNSIRTQSSRNDASVDRLHQLFEQISNRDNDIIDDATNESQPTATGDGGMPRLNEGVAAEALDESTDPRLNVAQNRALVTTVTWLNANERYIQDPIRNACPESLKMHISGQAGSGKSFFVRALADRIGNQRIACTSFMGVAASNLPRGVTINTEFAISVPGGRAPSLKKKAISRAHLQNVRVVIIGSNNFIQFSICSIILQMRSLKRLQTCL